MLASLTAKNQLTLPKRVLEALRSEDSRPPRQTPGRSAIGSWRTAPGGADQGVHRFNDAGGLVRQRCDGITQSVARDVGDLKRVEDDGTAVDYEMRPEMAVAPAEFTNRQQRNDHASRGIAKPIGLHNNNKWNVSPILPGVPVDIELIRHHSALNSSAQPPCFAMKALLATTCSSISC